MWRERDTIPLSRVNMPYYQDGNITLYSGDLHDVLLSTPTGGVILDPFAGSGTTLVAAKRQGRTCIGVELTDHNCDIAIERLNRTEPEQ